MSFLQQLLCMCFVSSGRYVCVCRSVSLVPGASKMKLTVKGAVAVDPESELEHSYQVLEEGK